MYAMCNLLETLYFKTMRVKLEEESMHMELMLHLLDQLSS